MSNIGRLCTSIRWQIEAIIGKIKKRYAVFGTKIPLNFIIYAGVALRYAISTHIHFEIGKIFPSKKRRIVLLYMRLAYTTWIDHPIRANEYDAIIPFCDKRGMGMDDQNPFKMVTCKAEIMKYWSQNIINYYLYDDQDRYVKGGGPGNMDKAKFSLVQSQGIIECWLGTGKYCMYMIVKNLRNKMKVVHEKNDSFTGRVSNVVYKIVRDDEAIQNDESTDIEFPKNIRYVTSRCSNIYGRRYVYININNFKLF